MRVIAIKAGYDGRRFRDPEALEDGRPVVFEMPDLRPGQKPASWYVEVDEEGNPLKAVPKKPKAQGQPAVPGQGPAKGAELPPTPGVNSLA